MPASSLEREIKLNAPERFRLPPLDGLADGLAASAERLQRSVSVYYDTDDWRLTRWDCGLRHRSSDGWTVKLPARADGPGVVRREFMFAGERGHPPAAALDLIQAVTRGQRVAPLARLRTIRRSVGIVDASGLLLAEVTNDYVAVLEGPRAGRRFREVEVEWAPECPAEVVEEILARLRGAGAGPPHGVPKHLRALGLDGGASAEVTPPEVGPDASAEQLIRLMLSRSVVALVRHDAGVRADEDSEDIHRMRVATRRLRAQLRLFRPLLDREWAEGLNQELRALGAALGRVRDADVLSRRLREALADLTEEERPAAKELLDRLAEARERDLASLLEQLRSPDYLRLVDRLIEASQWPRLRPEAEEPARSVLPPLVRKRWKRLARRVDRLPAEPSESELHGIRIGAKRTRYSVEALVPVLGKPARRFTRALRRVQQVLGEHQDAIVARAWLRRAAEHVPREAAFAAGALAAREARAAQATLDPWHEAWRAADDCRRAVWRRALRSVDADLKRERTRREAG